MTTALDLLAVFSLLWACIELRPRANELHDLAVGFAALLEQK